MIPSQIGNILPLIKLRLKSKGLYIIEQTLYWKQGRAFYSILSRLVRMVKFLKTEALCLYVVQEISNNQAFFKLKNLEWQSLFEKNH